MNKKYGQGDIRYIVTEGVSIGVVRMASKGEAYRTATKPSWGCVEWYSAKDGYQEPVDRDRSDKTQVLRCCDEDKSIVLFSKDGAEFCISTLEDVNVKEMPKQAETETIIISDSWGYTYWSKEDVKIFVTYDENGLIDYFRLDSKNGEPYDGETEIKYEDLQSEEDYNNIDRADIEGTYEYYRKMERQAQEAKEAELARIATNAYSVKEVKICIFTKEAVRAICELKAEKIARATEAEHVPATNEESSEVQSTAVCTPTAATSVLAVEDTPGSDSDGTAIELKGPEGFTPGLSRAACEIQACKFRLNLAALNKRLDWGKRRRVLKERQTNLPPSDSYRLTRAMVRGSVQRWSTAASP